MDDALGLAYTQQLQAAVTSPALQLVALTRSFGDQVAVDAVTLSVRSGELLALVGASGSGKTTTLRMAAGYERPDSGSVLLEGEDITSLSAQHRGFGMVFQHYALFPHLSVQDNVAFGLEARGVGRKERRDKARSALATVGLEHAAPRPVQSLSGGEQQRVALARAVVIEPRVLLLDEPLSNLDPTLRRSMREELRQMLLRLHVTALLVTHDQEDAFAVADRVAIMQKGRLLQVGRPEELYQRPASASVAGFIGKATLVPATVEGGRTLVAIGGEVVSSEFTVADPAERDRWGPWLAVLRPESLRIATAGTGGWRGTVASRRFAGAHFIYQVKLSSEVTLEAMSTDPLADEGDSVSVMLSGRPLALVHGDRPNADAGRPA